MKMRYVPDSTGRFQHRPHFASDELDGECERIICGFLRTTRRSNVDFPVTTDELWKLLEENTAAVDSYADLAEFGPGVEGVTEFRVGKKALVRISAELSANERRENRLRTTLAHEFGHVRFHAYLFELETDTLSLFPRTTRNQAARGRVVCKRETMLRAPQSDWMEWQAGYICGALLMPVSYLKRVAQDSGLRSRVHDGRIRHQDIVSAVVRSFQVSAQAAQVRLAKLGFLPELDGDPDLPSLPM